MSRQSTRARQSTRSCLACETGEIVCFLASKSYLQKIFRGSAPDPTHKAPSFVAGYAPGWLPQFFEFFLSSLYFVDELTRSLTLTAVGSWPSRCTVAASRDVITACAILTSTRTLTILTKTSLWTFWRYDENFHSRMSFGEYMAASFSYTSHGFKILNTRCWVKLKAKQKYTHTHTLTLRCMQKLGLKRIHRVTGYPVPWSTQTTCHSRLKYWNTIVDQCCFATSSISSEPVQVMGRQRVMVLIRSENSSHHCFISVKRIISHRWCVSASITTNSQWDFSTWLGVQ